MPGKYPSYSANLQNTANDIPGRLDICNASDYNDHDNEIIAHQTKLIDHDGRIITLEGFTFFWQRTTTTSTLSPVTANDSVDIGTGDYTGGALTLSGDAYVSGTSILKGISTTSITASGTMAASGVITAGSDITPHASGSNNVGTQALAFSEVNAGTIRADDGYFTNLYGALIHDYTVDHASLSNLPWSVAAHTIDTNIIPDASGSHNVGTQAAAFDEMNAGTIRADTGTFTDLYTSAGSLYIGQTQVTEIPGGLSLGAANFTTTGTVNTSEIFNSAGNLLLTGAIDLTSGNIVYVPIDGDIATYITAAANGDTLVLAAGTYTVTTTITVDKPLNIIGQGMGITTIYTATNVGVSGLIHVDTTTKVSIQNMTLSIDAANSDVLVGEDTTKVYFRNLELLNDNATGLIGGLFLHDVTSAILENINITLTGNAATGCSGVNVFLSATASSNQTVKMSNVRVTQDPTNTTTTNVCTFEANGVSGNTLTVTMDNCIVYDLGGGAGSRSGLSAEGTNLSITAEGCQFSGNVLDVENIDTATVILRNTDLVNGTTSGTITYDGTVVSEDFYASGDIILPTDTSTLYLGATNDATITFDGDSLNIVANAVTATDDLELTADTIQMNGVTLATDKVAFTQVDENEYIDSLNNGYLDIAATTAIRNKADLTPDASGSHDVGTQATAFSEINAGTGRFDALIATDATIGASSLTIGQTTVTEVATGLNIPNGLLVDSTTLIVDSSNDRVGIGTTSPVTTLEVNGDITVDEDVVPDASGTGRVGLVSTAFASGVFDNVYSTDGKISEYKTLSIPITNPTASDDFLIYRFREAVTIKEINACCMDGTSVTFKINECDANGDNAAQICNSCTATTSNTIAVITNPSVDAGDYISYTSSTNTGSVTKMIIAIDYTIN